jgi:hypothetical protein
VTLRSSLACGKVSCRAQIPGATCHTCLWPAKISQLGRLCHSGELSGGASQLLTPMPADLNRCAKASLPRLGPPSNPSRPSCPSPASRTQKPAFPSGPARFEIASVPTSSFPG